jgi:gluconolactonase
MRTGILSILGLALTLAANLALAQTPRYLTTGRITRQNPALDQVLAPDAKLEIVVSGYTHIEGPLWVPDSSMLLFSDTPPSTAGKPRVASPSFWKAVATPAACPMAKSPAATV